MRNRIWLDEGLALGYTIGHLERVRAELQKWPIDVDCPIRKKGNRNLSRHGPLVLLTFSPDGDSYINRATFATATAPLFGEDMSIQSPERNVPRINSVKATGLTTTLNGKPVPYHVPEISGLEVSFSQREPVGSTSGVFYNRKMTVYGLPERYSFCEIDGSAIEQPKHMPIIAGFKFARFVASTSTGNQ